MKQSEETPTEIKKRRTRRSPEKIVELVMEAERTGNAAEICRREGMSKFRNSRTHRRLGGLI